jgi:hypothetical protein
MKKRKPRKCRICKKSPVWTGGDVKNPGPVCKKCYHKHVWRGGKSSRDEELAEPAVLEPSLDPPPYPWCYDPDYYYVHVWYRDDDD